MCGDVLRFDGKPTTEAMSAIVDTLNELSNEDVYVRLDSLMEYLKPTFLRIFFYWCCQCYGNEKNNTSIECGGEDRFNLSIERFEDRFVLCYYDDDEIILESKSFSKILRYIEADAHCSNYDWKQSYISFSFNKCTECENSDVPDLDAVHSIGNKDGEYNTDPCNKGYRHWKEMTNFREYGVWYKDPDMEIIKQKYRNSFDRRDKYISFDGLLRSLLFRLEMHMPTRRFMKTKRAISA